MFTSPNVDERRKNWVKRLKSDNLGGSRAGAVVRALASHQCGLGSISRLVVACAWVEFVGSLLCSESERFSPGYSGFPLSSKSNLGFGMS